MTSSIKTPLTDYAALAADIQARKEQEGLELKEIAAQAGVEKSKLSNLINHQSGLSTDNLLLLCDWLGKTLYDYRSAEAPSWVVERIASANSISEEEAERLLAKRIAATHSQVRLSLAARALDGDEIVTADSQVAGASH